MSQIADPRQHDVACGLRVEAVLNELARAKLDVEGELFVHFLIEWHPPEPRSKRAFHGNVHRRDNEDCGDNGFTRSNGETENTALKEELRCSVAPC